MRSRCLGPSERIGTHDQLAGGRASGAPGAGGCEGVGVVRAAVSTGVLIAEAFRLGLTPVYVNELDAHAKRVDGQSSVGRHSLIYSKAFPKYAPGKGEASDIKLRVSHQARVCHFKEAEPSPVIQPSDELWGRQTNSDRLP
jgi:hypothetical protein